MEIELGKQDEKGTRVVVDIKEANGYQLLPLKWVYTYKTDARGIVNKFKSRIVVCGNQQWDDGQDTYAATLAARSYRILCAICCKRDYETHQYDCVNAFVNAHLKTPVFCKMPPGYGEKGKVWKLQRALHDLRISPRL
jgi:hypothetical protein